jgi:pyruvate kinase
VISQYADLGAEGAAGVIENAVQAALATDVVESGDTVVVVSGMMTDLDWSTTNTLKVHVAAETIGTGRGVVLGRAAGPLIKSSTGELTEIPTGSVLYLTEGFNRELSGDLSELVGIVHERPGMTGYPAMVARELGIPMASGVSLQSDISEGTVVTVDGERGVVYRGDVTRSDGAS